MRSHPVLLLLAALPLLAACAAKPEEPGFALAEGKPPSFQTYQGRPIYDGGDPNGMFAGVLLPGELAFERAREGQVVPLNTVIVMPGIAQDEEALLRIEFKRSDLRREFLRGFFFGEGPGFLRDHPFAQKGIEPVLTDTRLILIVHPSVLLHLRDGVQTYPAFRTFARKDAVGRVTAVSGDVRLSSEPDWTRLKLQDFYSAIWANLSIEDPLVTTVERPDGSVEVTAPPEAYVYPRQYEPRVMKGYR